MEAFDLVKQIRPVRVALPKSKEKIIDIYTNQTIFEKVERISENQIRIFLRLYEM